MTESHTIHALASVVAAPLGEAWHDFYLLSGTAAVTLVGLLFVALSLHIEILFRREHGDFREAAGQAFQGYLYVLVASLVFLVPVNNPNWTLMVYGGLNVVMLGRALLRVPAFLAARRVRGGERRHAYRFLLPFVAYALGILAVVTGLTRSGGTAIALLVPVLLMLTATTRTAWDLLEYVGRVRAGTDAASSP